MKKVLVRAPNWIGDAVMCLPALGLLKALYPAAHIAVLAKARVVPVFQGNPMVGEIIEYDSGKSHKGIRGRFRLSSELRERDFSLAVLFQNAFDAAFIVALARIPERAGYARDLRGWLLTKSVAATADILKRHQVFYYMNIIRELGGDLPSSTVPRLYITKEERAWAASFIEKSGLYGKRLIGAAPGASFGPAKRWPAERFAEVLKGLAHGNCAALVFGGPEDKEACASVQRHLPEALDFSGKLTLRQSIALSSHLALMITNDSGAMHLSAALGVPTVAIFGSTEDTLTGPVGDRVAVVRKKIECSPCFERTCRYGHYNCLVSIEAMEVIEAAEGLLR